MHLKSQLFSLIGRKVITRGSNPVEGVILAKGLGCSRYLVSTPAGEGWHGRAMFTLPPLPKSERAPLWLPDDSAGFAYRGVIGF
jgi:hypothetical protein